MIGRTLEGNNHCDLKAKLNGDSGDISFGFSSTEGRLFYISLHSALLKGFKIKVMALDPSTGVQTDLTTLSSENEIISPDSVLFVGTNDVLPLIIWTDKAFKTLKINVIGTKRISSFNIRLSNEQQIDRIFIHGPRTRGAPPHFLAHYQSRKSHWAEVYHVDLMSGAIEKEYSLPTLDGVGAFSTSTQGTNVYFIRNTDFEGLLVSSVKQDILSRWPVRSQINGDLTDPLGVSHAISEVLSKGDSKFAVRSALILPSGDLELLQNGKQLWVRLEGLAGVIAAAFVEPSEGEGLAQELAVESHSSVFTAYTHRLNRHFRDLRHLPAWAESLPARIRANILGKATHSDIPGKYRDGFGFQKLIIVVTERGRLLGLESGNNGAVVWDIKLRDFSVHGKFEVISIETERGTALIRGNEGAFWLVETLTGKILQHQPGGLLADLKTAISVPDVSGEKIFIPVHRDGSLGHYPKSKIPKDTFLVTRGIGGILRGWRLANDAGPALAWEFMPTPEETITTVVARPAHDPVASIGKALGDRNVLYKFLNPNVLFVATVDSESAAAAIYILDSASGQILHTASHSNIDTSRSITAVMSENWFAYSIFSDTVDLSPDSSTNTRQYSKGFQLIVSELFESQFPNDRGPLGSSQNFSSIYPTTSDDGETFNMPYVISQAYSIPGPISLLSVTSTAQGITPRSLLGFLPSLNALISIPRSMVDPRRPVGRDPVAAELEEGLLRYNILLEFDPKWIISHKRDIMSLSDVVTNPSRLESTSLLFAFGDIDIFGTRVAPIGAFDLLGKGFSKLQLVGTVVALAIGTGILAPMVSLRSILPACQ